MVGALRFDVLLYISSLSREVGRVLFVHHLQEQVVGLFVEELEAVVHAGVEQGSSFVREVAEGGEIIVGGEVDLQVVPQEPEEGFGLLLVVYGLIASRRLDDRLRNIVVHYCNNVEELFFEWSKDSDIYWFVQVFYCIFLNIPAESAIFATQL